MFYNCIKSCIAHCWWRKPCYNQAIYVLLMHSFFVAASFFVFSLLNVYAFWVCYKIGVITSRMTQVFNLEKKVLPSARHYWTFRKHCSKLSSEKWPMQRWFSDTLISARPLRGCLTSVFQACVSTPPLCSSRWQCIENHVWSQYWSY